MQCRMDTRNFYGRLAASGLMGTESHVSRVLVSDVPYYKQRRSIIQGASVKILFVALRAKNMLSST